VLSFKITKASYLRDLAKDHVASRHPFLQAPRLSAKQAIHLLFNYDAHASLLRRLLLNAAGKMPEPAVGFILENVRNEYGNGNYDHCHQGQLRDLMFKLARLAPGVHPDKVSSGVRAYMKAVVEFYDPTNYETTTDFYLPAVIAGAISATEIMALGEFRSLHQTFHDFKLEKHIWFDHVTVEAEHTDEALALAEYFLSSDKAKKAVEYGFKGVLDANCHLYDGLMESTSF
jgi:hypothetical protein